jgi:DNA (cytosine-5)-methyltransferase 1
LEGEAYAVGAVVLGAHSVGAPHRRQRLYWVADSQLYRRSPRGRDQRGEEITRGPHWDNTQRRSVAGGRLADSQGDGRHQECQDGGRGDDGGATQRGAARLGLCSANHWAESIWISCRDGKHRRAPAEPALCPLVDGIPYQLARRGSVRPSLLKGAGNAIVPQVGAAFIQAFLTPC